MSVYTVSTAQVETVQGTKIRETPNTKVESKMMKSRLNFDKRIPPINKEATIFVIGFIFVSIDERKLFTDQKSQDVSHGTGHLALRGIRSTAIPRLVQK